MVLTICSSSSRAWRVLNLPGELSRADEVPRHEATTTSLVTTVTSTSLDLVVRAPDKSGSRGNKVRTKAKHQGKGLERDSDRVVLPTARPIAISQMARGRSKIRVALVLVRQDCNYRAEVPWAEVR